MFLSVIIPVFNGERFIRKCFDSVIDQKIDQIEIIAIDDGSSDRSPDILCEYDEKYDFFHLYTQENKGAASARNVGLHFATGKYIAFMDCDDWLDEGCLKKVFDVMDKSVDMLIFGWRRVGMKEKGEYIQPDKIYKSGKEYLIDVLNGVIKGPNSQCWHIYNRQFLIKFGIRYDEGFRQAEDALFNNDIINVLSKAQAVNIVGYNWRIENTSSVTYHYADDFPEIMELYERKLRKMICKFGLQNNTKVLTDYYRIEYSIFNLVYISIQRTEKAKDEKKRHIEKCLSLNISNTGIKQTQKGIRKILLLSAKKRINTKLLKVWEMTQYEYWRYLILSTIMTYVIPGGSVRRRVMYSILGKKETKENFE